MKKLVALLLACMLILAAAAAMAEPSGTVMLYSSLKEKQLVAVKEAFEAKYPGIVMDYYQAGTGKIKTKIATEQQAGQVAADLLWVGDASDYLTFKKQGILEAYVSPESEKVPAAYKDEDDLYCGARLVVDSAVAAADCDSAGGKPLSDSGRSPGSRECGHHSARVWWLWAWPTTPRT